MFKMAAIYKSPRCFLASLESIGLSVQEKKRKIDFQDGGHHGFPIGTILAIFDLQVTPVAQLDASSDWRPGGRGFNPRRGRQHSFVEIDHEIFSTVILSLPLIQEGQLSVSGERMCTILFNRLED